MQHHQKRESSSGPNAKAERDRMQLHVSGISMLNDCGIRFEFRYIKGIKLPPSAFTIAGTGTDKAVGANLQNKIDSGVLLKIADVEEIAHQSTLDAATREDIELLDAEEKSKGRKVVVSEAADKARRLASQHHTSIAPEIRPAEVARKFSINLDSFLRSRAKLLHKQADELLDPYARKLVEGQARALNAIAKKGLDFVGEQDILERFALPTTLSEDEKIITHPQAVAIRDTKTSAKTPGKDAETGQYKIIDQSDQLTAYALASQVLDGKLPEYVALDYLIDLKGGVKPLTIKSTRTAADVEQFLLRLQNTIHALHSGVFVPTKPDDWRCSQKWCGYFSICPYAKHPKTIAT